MFSILNVIVIQIYDDAYANKSACQQIKSSRIVVFVCCLMFLIPLLSGGSEI